MTASLVTVSRDALRVVLADHFVMWHELDGVGPPGEWRCACGNKFGFSDSAIDHQVDALLAVVRAADTLTDDEALNRTIAGLRREVGPSGVGDGNWRPMIAASEVWTLLDALAAALDAR